MALLKVCACPTCRNLVEYPNVFCKEHEDSDKQRYKQYKATRTDKKEQALYKSAIWYSVKESVISSCFGIDIYKFYTENLIETVELVHHIIEVKEDWNKRLDTDNLIALTEESHSKIHHIYNQSKEAKKECQAMLRQFKQRFDKEFRF